MKTTEYNIKNYNSHLKKENNFDVPIKSIIKVN